MVPEWSNQASAAGLHARCPACIPAARCTWPKIPCPLPRSEFQVESLHRHSSADKDHLQPGHSRSPRHSTNDTESFGNFLQTKYSSKLQRSHVWRKAGKGNRLRLASASHPESGVHGSRRSSWRTTGPPRPSRNQRAKRCGIARSHEPSVSKLEGSQGFFTKKKLKF